MKNNSKKMVVDMDGTNAAESTKMCKLEKKCNRWKVFLFLSWAIFINFVVAKMY